MSKGVLVPGVALHDEHASRRERSTPYRVLVADDDRDVLHVLASVIGSLGHEVRTASTGALALLALYYFEPDVVLIELSMPLMNGSEVARRIRRMPLHRPPRLVALTDNASVTKHGTSQVAEFDAQLVKPFSVSTLQEAIASGVSAVEL